MKAIKEYKELQNENVDENLLKEVIEKSKHICENCKYKQSQWIRDNGDGYRATYKDYCSNQKMIRDFNNDIRSIKQKYPNITNAFDDRKPIVGYEICDYFESRFKE